VRACKGKARECCETWGLRVSGASYSWPVSPLMWWLIPIGATILAIAWAMLRSRPARPISTDESMESLRRMQAALNRQMPGTDRSDPER
jgi:hypothetical protein